jgi:Ca-activated chloride channel family protein
MPGEVTLTHQLGKEYLPVTGGSQVAYVLLEAKPTALMAQVRMPLNFALVIDHSGSMRGPKLRNVREAVKLVIDRLDPSDYISVVIFDDTAQVIIPSMPANDKPGMKAAIDRIQDAGGTTMSLGMVQGLYELRRWNIQNAINRMILLTDGVTYGDTDRCRQLAREAATSGISIYPLGIGSDWDENLLDDIGQISGGSPAEFIRSPADAMAVFEQQVQSAVAVAVRNAVLTLRLPAGVSPRRAVKVLPIIQDINSAALSDRQVTVTLGDLEKETAQSVLVELMIDPRPAGLFRICQAELTYDVPVVGLSKEQIRDDIKVTFTTDTNLVSQVNALVMNFAERTNAQRLVTRMLDEYKSKGTVTTKISPNVTRVLDSETLDALQQMTEGKQISQEQVKSIGNKTRKLTQRLDDLLP